MHHAMHDSCIMYVVMELLILVIYHHDMTKLKLDETSVYRESSRTKQRSAHLRKDERWRIGGVMERDGSQEEDVGCWIGTQRW